MARDMIASLSPDVLTLDLEMPRMDGLTFLRLLMERAPMPVVVLSSLTESGSDFALEALRLGAVEVLGKADGSYSFRGLGAQLVSKVKTAASSRVRGARNGRPVASPPPAETRFNPRTVLLLGASTGGTEALAEVLPELPANAPAVAIVQHIPAMFSRQFASRLDRECAIEVREAADGDELRPGLALVAPGDSHMMIQQRGGTRIVRIRDGPLVCQQRPSVDLLFKSAAESGLAPHCVAGLLTGMGRDGADGLLELHRQGARTFVQDEASCVVWGMPRAAEKAGAAQSVVPLDRIAAHILELSSSNAPAVGTAHP
jgi:two-component system chemotaxis response regulator CheB